MIAEDEPTYVCYGASVKQQRFVTEPNLGFVLSSRVTSESLRLRYWSNNDNPHT